MAMALGGVPRIGRMALERCVEVRECVVMESALDQTHRAVEVEDVVARRLSEALLANTHDAHKELSNAQLQRKRTDTLVNLR
jgi:hypothetical protein